MHQTADDRISTNEMLTVEPAHPPGFLIHRLRLVLVALLGYGYTVCVAGILIVLGSSCLNYVGVHSFWLSILWAGLVVAFFVGGILRRQISPPAGIPLARSQYKKLFEFVDSVRLQAGSPRISSIIISSGFNCSVTGDGRRQVLNLGLPLLQSLSLSDFKSVLAHELGHLSCQHGKFNLWCYHFGSTVEQANKSTHWSRSFLQPFMHWYCSMLESTTGVFIKQHELEADQVMKTLVGGEVGAKALIVTELQGTLYQTYLKGVYEGTVNDPYPPQHVFALFQELRQQPSLTAATKIIESQWTDSAPGDVHPPLLQRLQALVPYNPADHLTALVAGALDQNKGPGAAETLLETSLDEVLERVGELWADSVLPSWQTNYRMNARNRQRYSRLEKEAAQGNLSKESGRMLAHFYASNGRNDAALSLLRDLVDQHPNNPKLNYTLGEALLSANDRQGLEYLANASRLDPGYAEVVFISISKHFTNQADNEAEHLLAVVDGIQKRYAHEWYEYERSPASKQFENHQMTTEDLTVIADCLDQQPMIKRAHLACRRGPRVQHVLILEMFTDPWWQYQPRATQTAKELAVVVQLRENYYLAGAGALEPLVLCRWTDAPKGLQEYCRSAAALVYDYRGPA